MTKLPRADTWVIGAGEMPAYIEEKGADPFRPHVVLISSDDGLIRATALGPADELEGLLAQAIHQAMATPMAGSPGPPGRVVVPSKKLAGLVADQLPGVAIDVGPVPQFDEAMAAMKEAFSSLDAGGDPPSYLTSDATPQVVADFFMAAADLYRRAPWTIAPNDRSIFRVTSSRLGINKAVGCIIGQMGESFGVILFSSLADYERYYDLASRAAVTGAFPSSVFPRHLAVNFESARDLPAEMVREANGHRWEVADPAAYPTVMLIDTDAILRPPTSADYVRATAVVRALVNLIDAEPHLAQAWLTRADVRRRFKVAAGDDHDVAITIGLV